MWSFFLRGCLPLRNKLTMVWYALLAQIAKLWYFPGVGGWPGGWPGREIKNKANLSPTELPAELELGLSLAIYVMRYLQIYFIIGKSLILNIP